MSGANVSPSPGLSKNCFKIQRAPEQLALSSHRGVLEAAVWKKHGQSCQHCGQQWPANHGRHDG